MTDGKAIIYQVFTRLYGNPTNACVENGTIESNGCGKMAFFKPAVLERIRRLGVTHVWYTGIIRHATTTDYSAYGIPCQHAGVVKGRAGSPYAIVDYYDVDPDIATDVSARMQEFEQLVARTHAVGLKVVIDFVPNHVARQYHSLNEGAAHGNLGDGDDTTKAFDSQNNFYYCTGQAFAPSFDTRDEQGVPYGENPAKATGNDCFYASPSKNDWYETVKLNYGVDYCGGRVCHFDPAPDTWTKMLDALLFWADKGVDAFRCDMAEMVPVAFWKWALPQVKALHPSIMFIAEIYNPSAYAAFIAADFDYLYDKVGMYDTVRAVICGLRPAADITEAWQSTGSSVDHMLYFLENHDEQRIASDYFASDARKGVPALMANALMRRNPFMLYAGQEYGERGMDKEGFSGIDGRTTIFDYWTIGTLYRAYYDRKALTESEKHLADTYRRVLNIAKKERAIGSGETFDLMYVNGDIGARQYAFMRKAGNEVLLVVANFDAADATVSVNIPTHAFDYLGIPARDAAAIDLLTGEKTTLSLGKKCVTTTVKGYYGVIYKFKTKMESDYQLNEHNKEEFPPAHTAEHLLNQTMVRLFGCGRSTNAHVERKKSKISYVLDHKPSRKDEKDIERIMNELIAADLPVKYEFVKREDLPDDIDAERLPADASETIRLVRIGDYDVCPCMGKHVRSTAQIGRFEMLGTNWDELSHTFRIRFKVVQ